MTRKSSVTVIHETGSYRLYAQELEDGRVSVWTKTWGGGIYNAGRFGDRLGRDWFRALFAESEVTLKF